MLIWLAWPQSNASLSVSPAIVKAAARTTFGSGCLITQDIDISVDYLAEPSLNFLLCRLHSLLSSHVLLLLPVILSLLIAAIALPIIEVYRQVV